ncbi:hypothetical protein HPB51_029525 [Rhipicephalus microplus]|uniref:Secreted protein n=1 Tax=Rhipicephalus microplus TaxID=6941 RepID=A0A9J6CTW8_RHIMP|nr:hypothetical protein HPB51_029525 [Rhipicephalus microplus]
MGRVRLRVLLPACLVPQPVSAQQERVEPAVMYSQQYACWHYLNSKDLLSHHQHLLAQSYLSRGGVQDKNESNLQALKTWTGEHHEKGASSRH